MMTESLLKMPQWTTGSRLLKQGEKIEFHFLLPDSTEAEDLTIFPRYLERANPGKAFVAGGDLAWLDTLESEQIDLKFANGRASLTYQPEAAGNYIARWRAGDEVFYRYFSVIEDDSIVLRFSTFVELEAEPTLHATGIPLDYRLPIEQFDPNDPLFQKFFGYHRQYGDTIVPHFPDTPEMRVDERVKVYGEGLEKVRTLLPDGNDARSARVMMHHDFDTGYTETFIRLGVNDHCGLQEANAKPWLGMPEFPYFSSPVDCRKMNQGEGGSVVAHQWDFCGGWHFLGPVMWHYAASEGQWGTALECLRQGMKEAKNLVELSGHSAFLVPLYDGVTKHYGYPNGLFNEGYGDEPMFRFVERYQRQMAFEFTKAYNLVFARTIDIADYYRRHFKATPRTVFVSKTDHVLYDMWWLCHWAGERRLVPRERIPWLTRISTLMNDRKTKKYCRGNTAKDPLSYEYILVEDQKRQMRFERESPNPIWWFDYTIQERGPQGSAITHVETPDVDIVRSQWHRDENGLTIKLKMLTQSEFQDYAIALWGLPAAFSRDQSRVETSAKEFILAKNTDGEFHLILVFDLKPDAELQVTLREP
jgi:hypothetical protein